MPAPANTPRTLRLAAIVGLLEGLALIGYAISIATFEFSGSTSGISGTGADLAPGVLVAVYLGFAVLVLAVTRWLHAAKRRAVTPYLMVQVFAAVVGQPLLSASQTRLIGIVVLAIAALGAGAAIAPGSRTVLQ